MNRHRYEPVAQNDEYPPPTNPIILSPLNAPNYNFNTGLPQSHTPSITSSTPSATPSISNGGPPNIPNSPPPSFHTYSTPGTPRPTPSHTTSHNPSSRAPHSHQAHFPSAELWGIAPSTIDIDDSATTATIQTSNDALATIAGLKQRVEWLEESLGRLLLQKDSSSPPDPPVARDNCCIAFTDASPDMERAIRSANSNCCVTFKSSKGREREMAGKWDEKRQRRWLIAGCFCVFAFCTMVSVLAISGAQSRRSMAMEVEGSGVKGVGLEMGAEGDVNLVKGRF